MRKAALLNSDLARVIALSGHTDEITIGDAGLPIAARCERIDLALTHGVPSFIDTLTIVATELQIEAVVLATEIKTNSGEFHQLLLNTLATLGDAQGQAIAVSYVSHEQFKLQSQNSRAVVRTGECTPYANIILQAGVAFK
ncbi:D-ribose pyranase [Ferrimonas lipolytica]|uniref:D-ribose pyranase n=1 Tax=Ferrimonas lipolytica TaxID=2724191 RepID=A0A6H1UE63_9GAMM|nr:D-ribose pyranase [Ferrimonas lipolytica]QIZ77118.1 D-ribose pyranase [Ferrimonas lipolytica]